MDPEACLCREGSLLDLGTAPQYYCTAMHTAPSLCCSLMCTRLWCNLQSQPKWLRTSRIYFAHCEPKMSVNVRIFGASQGLPDGKFVRANFHKWSGQDHLEVETPQMQIKTHVTSESSIKVVVSIWHVYSIMFYSYKVIVINQSLERYQQQQPGENDGGRPLTNVLFVKGAREFNTLRESCR